MLYFKAKGNSQLLRVTVTDEDTGDPVIAATVNVTLIRNGAQVPGETWPLAASHVGAGVYEAALSENLDLAAGDILTAVAEVDDGPGRKRVSRIAGFAEEA